MQIASHCQHEDTPAARRRLDLLAVRCVILVFLALLAFHAAPAGGAEATVKVSLPGGVLLELVRIPAGSFMMGSPPDERGRGRNEPLHPVTITRDYLVGKYEVTQGQWNAVMGLPLPMLASHCNNPGGERGANPRPTTAFGVGLDFPVYCVSWDEIRGPDGFLARLNEYLNSTGQAGAHPIRLPTEAEWERAARAGTSTRFSHGDVLECSDRCRRCKPHDQHMVWCGNTRIGNKPVGSKSPNGYGLHDMHGNVSEWVEDWYGNGYGHFDRFGGLPAAPPSPAAVLDPKGPSSGTSRVARGGNWSGGSHGVNATWNRSAYRSGSPPDWNHVVDLGFRVARSVGIPQE